MHHDFVHMALICVCLKALDDKGVLFRVPTHLHICVCVCVYVCVYMHIYAYLYIYIGGLGC